MQSSFCSSCGHRAASCGQFLRRMWRCRCEVFTLSDVGAESRSYVSLIWWFVPFLVVLHYLETLSLPHRQRGISSLAHIHSCCANLQSVPNSSGEFVSISAGLNHTCGVRRDNSVECWGDDEYGQATPPSGEFAAVSAGIRHTCGVRLDGAVQCWGSNEYGKATPP